LHAAELLLEHGRVPSAIAQCSAVLGHDSGNVPAIQLLARATAQLTGLPATPAEAAGRGFDWGAAEAQVTDVVQPAFIDGPDGGTEVDVQNPGVRLR
jgi:hypothetical protein